MEVSNLLTMESAIVLGIINERLRIECDSYENLLSRYELEEGALNHKMALLGYQYDPTTNQFKGK
ncbi:DUF4250 domain-containing protein [Thalassotalea nanhaiensis]|uniref:DUF4250 domain-containing protein n=1 Tax=Thalassotalea nanhaiensis TaxID=3065648 RepID=A0ABY9THF1_9GAMM|nr:DUF4250 domain-containing protein [Colwelliaceae bacterium SQ345]